MNSASICEFVSQFDEKITVIEAIFRLVRQHHFIF